MLRGDGFSRDEVLLSASSANRDMLDRFTREIRVLAGLNHPNIAALYTAFHHDGPIEEVEFQEKSHGLEQGAGLCGSVYDKQGTVISWRRAATEAVHGSEDGVDGLSGCQFALKLRWAELLSTGVFRLSDTVA